MITPPWQTDDHRLAGVRVDDRVEHGHDPGAEPLRVLAAEVLPAPFDHRLPALVLRSRAAPPSGCSGRRRRRTRAARRRSRPRGRERVAIGAAVSSGAAQRAAHDVVHRLRCEPRAEPLRLLVRRARVSSGSTAAPPDSPGPMRTGSAWRTSTQVHQAPSRREAEDARPARRVRRIGSATLIVVIPSARAGLRLMPRSSRNTALGRRDAEALAAPARRCAGRACADPRRPTRRRRRSGRGGRAREEHGPSRRRAPSCS